MSVKCALYWFMIGRLKVASPPCLCACVLTLYLITFTLVHFKVVSGDCVNQKAQSPGVAVGGKSVALWV